MEWRDEGVLLSVRRHGEGSAIIEVFTEAHGRHAGVVRGGASRKMAPLLQPGAQLQVSWRARLEEHLGSFTAEPIKSRAGTLMADRAALAALTSITGLIGTSLPEREAHRGLYLRSLALLDLLETGENWWADYVGWELYLLTEMGFGLDLSACAVTGATDGLCYVSPKSGRAVSAKGGAEWADRLLPLPAFLRSSTSADRPAIRDGLRLTGYFLENWMCPALGRERLPQARDRLLRALEKSF